MTWEEYFEDEYDFGDEQNPDLSDPATAEEWKLMEEDKILFQAADMNQDGKLDNKEYLAFTHPEEDPSMKPHVLRQVPPITPKSAKLTKPDITPNLTKNFPKLAKTQFLLIGA